jgi:hypothetical protein
MLLYITAEDVLGSDTPRRRGPRPLPTTPETVAGLYDLGFRHHVRAAALAWWTGEKLERAPDWKLDRQSIRLALFGRERLGLEPGARAVAFGRLGWLWPALDFGAMGFGVVPVGIGHDLGDDDVAAMVARAAAPAAFATDAESAGRLVRLRRAGRLGEATVVADGVAEETGVLPLAALWELAAVLDTPERSQSFRGFSRHVRPDDPALWHADANGLVRLTHGAAMARTAPLLRARTADEGDVAYLDAPRVTLSRRLALAAFVGDGVTTTVLGREGRALDDVSALRPHKLLASEPWLAAACGPLAPRWPAGLDRRRSRRRVLERLGGRLRWIETGSPVPDATARAVSAAGIALDVGEKEVGEPFG